MKNDIGILLFSISLSSALYVLLMSSGGFDTAYWLAVTVYELIWFLLLGCPILLILKKYKNLKVIYFSILGAFCAGLSQLLPHLKDVYLANVSSLTLQEGQNVIFRDGIITEYAINQFYMSLAIAIFCGLFAGVIYGFLKFYIKKQGI